MAKAIEDDAARQIGPLVESPNRIATDALAFATRFCRSRLATNEDVATLLKQNDAVAHDYFRYGLATRLAQHLSDIDHNVQAIYVCNWDELPDDTGAKFPGVTSPLSLIICVTRKTAALIALLAELNMAITMGYRDIVAPQAHKLSSFLDAHLVDDDEISCRTGYAAAVTSIHARPNRVWERKPAH